MTTTLTGPRTSVPPEHSVSRDGFVDTLRVFAIVLVVLQHWLMPVIAYKDGQLHTGNALSADLGWMITWISQVMPLIFFAGGAAAAISLRRRRAQGAVSDSGWVADRVRRLAVPVLGLAAVWLPGPHLLLTLGVPAEPVITAARLVGALLWFLAAYVLITMASPLMLRLADTWRGREVAVLALGAVVVDVLRFSTDASWLGYANVILIWGAVHQFGVHYGSGRLTAVRGRRALALAAAGFTGTALAVTFGPYPLSMIGMPGDAVSNMNPPAAVLLALAAGQLGLALWMRPMITLWAARRPVARGLSRASSSAMTIYLWHTPALVLVAGVAVLGFGQHTPEPGSGMWFTQLPLWLTLLSVMLIVLVRLAARVERFVLPSAPVAPAQVVGASLLVAFGLLGLTLNGFRPDLAAPIVATVAIAAGVLLLGAPLTWSSQARTGRLSA
ncbi:acyltransferase family protein [Ruania halotolerans]|uniref:acyltransferase family protein n=1 Tax=Ruania halotolerans TaxID=2897773 RepID=UPI001E42C3D1|nr:acyltransferase [Ruania halotolerans]UFU05080.1 acyltransferase [Ruania halotolerans]